jgi:hypothetical protein
MPPKLVLPSREMQLADRIRRWWNPAQWRDDHPEVSERQPLTEERREARWDA